MNRYPFRPSWVLALGAGVVGVAVWKFGEACYYFAMMVWEVVT